MVSGEDETCEPDIASVRLKERDPGLRCSSKTGGGRPTSTTLGSTKELDISRTVLNRTNEGALLWVCLSCGGWEHDPLPNPLSQQFNSKA